MYFPKEQVDKGKAKVMDELKESREVFRTGNSKGTGVANRDSEILLQYIGTATEEKVKVQFDEYKRLPLDGGAKPGGESIPLGDVGISDGSIEEGGKILGAEPNLKVGEILEDTRKWS